MYLRERAGWRADADFFAFQVFRSAGMTEKKRNSAQRSQAQCLSCGRNGNDRDFDVIPSFAGNYAYGYILRFEIVTTDTTALLHPAGYYLDGRNNLRIFPRQEEIRSRFTACVAGQIYTARATSIFDTGGGAQAGRWSEPFIERVFPLRERSQSVTSEVRF